ncbi:MAG: transketolase [Deltaproteobacteria bacterium]|nr:transketolase [Deltaproteobacteria bacterium]
MSVELRADTHALVQRARDIRARVIEISHNNEVPHLASNLSCIDLLVATYWGYLDVHPVQPPSAPRDRFILSKGHAASALYAALAQLGFIADAELDSIAQNGSRLAEHPSRKTPGVEAATGSLGHGLGIGIGLALADRMLGHQHRVVVLMSDGEQNEGSVWEAAMFAPRHRLSRLTALVDFNGWQATGRSRDVLALEPLAEKWRAFGWDVAEVDGHDMTAVVGMLNRPDVVGPKMIIAHTVKGKGVSFMEDDNNWHYRVPTADEVVRAHRELGRR